MFLDLFCLLTAILCVKISCMTPGLIRYVCLTTWYTGYAAFALRDTLIGLHTCTTLNTVTPCITGNHTFRDSIKQVYNHAHFHYLIFWIQTHVHVTWHLFDRYLIVTNGTFCFANVFRTFMRTGKNISSDLQSHNLKLSKWNRNESLEFKSLIKTQSTFSLNRLF